MTPRIPTWKADMSLADFTGYGSKYYTEVICIAPGYPTPRASPFYPAVQARGGCAMAVGKGTKRPGRWSRHIPITRRWFCAIQYPLPELG
jgi:hypothetical protein